jgi:hypothetical protein
MLPFLYGGYYKMRALIIIFFFFALLFGLGTILMGAFGEDQRISDYSLSAIPASVSNPQPATGSTEVDRNDDVTIENPCTIAPNDCTLRNAILIANGQVENTTITFDNHYLIRVDTPLPPLSAAHLTLQARPEQEVHIDGNGKGGSVLRITGNFVRVIGLRIYGAGAGFPNITITDTAHDIVIANNIIGDGDGPAGNCDSSDSSHGGIYIDATGTIENGARAWIYGNIIECHSGSPGEGITIFTDSVIVGQDEQGRSDEAQRNVIRENQGIGINLNSSTGNLISNNDLINNRGGGVFMRDFNNDWMNNYIENSS